MQTRRDQLQAYKFQNRRALAALITGEPNVVDPPMRRLTITTLSGVMIAVLLTVGFTVYGLIRPKAGDSWKEAGTIVIEDNSGTAFVYLNGKLNPVINFTSGLLAAGGSKRANVVSVTSDDIGGAKRGPQIGIPGLPSELPDPGDLAAAPVAACSRQQAVTGDQVAVKVSVNIGDDLGARSVGADDGVLVDTGQGSQSYLLYDGRRLAIALGRTATALGYADRQPLQVGRAFLDAVPQGTALRAPTIAGAGTPANLSGLSATIGQLITTPGGRDFVAMPDGRAQVTALQRALLQTLPIGPGGTLLDPVQASESAVLQLPESTQWNGVVSSQLQGLPGTVPRLSATPSENGGVCALFRAGADEPRFAAPPNSLPSSQATRISESALSQRGLADSVVLPAGGASLIGANGSASTVFLVGDSGRKFAAGSNDLLGALGYTLDDVTKLPASLIKLIPTGPAMTRREALRPISN